MLTYVVLCITVYLVIQILRASRSADAMGYLLVSALLPLPVYMIGQSVDAAVFPIDICLFTYLAGHGLSVLHYVIKRRIVFVGLGSLFGFCVLATCSGAFNFLFVDSHPAKFYVFTIVKLWEYLLLATALMASRPDTRQIRRICKVVLVGILVYEILHVLHISGILPLSGEAYFGPGAAARQDSISPFSDRSAWFLTSSRDVIAGTASIGAWFSIMVFEAYRGRLKMLGAVAAILSIFSVFATTSRSDISGLALASIVFTLSAPPRRWKAYLSAAVLGVGLYGASLMFFLPPTVKAVEIERISELWRPELRASGTYSSRVNDRKSLLRYLPEHPRDLLVGVGPGNFHSYQTQGITINYMGHNSYLHWTGELGIGGGLLLMAWCLSLCGFAKRQLRSDSPISRVAARSCLAVVTGRMVAAWGAESLFGTEGMGHYSLFFIGVVYLLVWIASDASARNYRLHRQAEAIGGKHYDKAPSYAL